ncbi:MAG: CocE/NonD family hydrolase, partial [Actinomycetota bacterium]
MTEPTVPSAERPSLKARIVVLLVVAALPSLPVGADAQLDRPLSPCPTETSSKAEPDWADRLPRSRPTAVEIRDVQVESRDGALVSVREYVPRAFAGRRPSVLVMSPYHALLGLYAKEAEDLKIIERADCITKFFNEHGYVVVLGDMRGTRNSDGCFDYGGPGDQADGYAVVQWMARQAWSNGRVGMYGVSHVGMSQYAAAVRTPPALKAIIPIAPITSFYRYLHNGGVHYETNMGTPVAYDYGAAGPPPTNVTGANHLRNVAGSFCNGENTLRGMSLDGDFTQYWRQRDYSLMARRIKAAVFHVHGTIDQNVKMDHFTSMWRALEAANVPR